VILAIGVHEAKAIDEPAAEIAALHLIRQPARGRRRQDRDRRPFDDRDLRLQFPPIDVRSVEELHQEFACPRLIITAAAGQKAREFRPRQERLRRHFEQLDEALRGPVVREHDVVAHGPDQLLSEIDERRLVEEARGCNETEIDV
jgi:hypothetical protein